jgi:hypothetical protein
MMNKRVKIIIDCREDADASGMYGYYVGDFKPPNFSFENPKIILDNGETIWGIECWWEFVDDVIGSPFDCEFDNLI